MLLQWRGSDGWDVVTMKMKDWKAKGEFGFRGAGMVDVRSNAGANVGRSPTPKVLRKRRRSSLVAVLQASGHILQAAQLQ